MKKYVAYYRVSTQKQGVSGLGLESQQSIVKQFVGTENIIIDEFQEIESGKKDNRQKLNQAIETAKINNAVLIVAKLDRLSRNVIFLFELRDALKTAGVEFVVCNMPQVNDTMTLGIYATMAQAERELISQRTKDGLKAKRARMAGGDFTSTRKNADGTARQMVVKRLGSPVAVKKEVQALAVETIKNNALNNIDNKKAYGLIESMRQQNLSYEKIAKKLNELGFQTSRNGFFYANSVLQLERMFNKSNNMILKKVA